MEETQTYQRIKTLLENIPHEEFKHAHVHSSEDAAKVRGTRLEEAAKALVLKTGSGKLVQCIVAGHRRLDLKRIKQLLGEKNIALAHPEEVLLATGCPVGSVPPFGNLFGLPIYADAEIFERDFLVFSAGSHYRSVRMRCVDWQRIVGAQIAEIGKSA